MLTPEDFEELKPTFEEIRRLLSAARIAGQRYGKLEEAYGYHIVALGHMENLVDEVENKQGHKVTDVLKRVGNVANSPEGAGDHWRSCRRSISPNSRHRSWGIRNSGWRNCLWSRWASRYGGGNRGNCTCRCSCRLSALQRWCCNTGDRVGAEGQGSCPSESRQGSRQVLQIDGERFARVVGACVTVATQSYSRPLSQLRLTVIIRLMNQHWHYWTSGPALGLQEIQPCDPTDAELVSAQGRQSVRRVPTVALVRDPVAYDYRKKAERAGQKTGLRFRVFLCTESAC